VLLEVKNIRVHYKKVEAIKKRFILCGGRYLVSIIELTELAKLLS